MALSYRVKPLTHNLPTLPPHYPRLMKTDVCLQRDQFTNVHSNFIYLWLHWVLFAAQRLSPAAAHGLLNVVGSLVSEHGLQSAGSVIVVNRLQLLCGMWDLPRPGIEPLLPALAGGFSTRGPPAESHSHVIHRCFQQVNGHELCIYTMEYYLIKRRNCWYTE